MAQNFHNLVKKLSKSQTGYLPCPRPTAEQTQIRHNQTTEK